MSRVRPRDSAIFGLLFAGLLTGSAAPPPASAYLQQIKPVLEERCYACHGALKQKHGLRLDTAEFIRQGGKDGPVISPGRTDHSRLLQRLTATDEAERMPPEGEPLKPDQIAAIKAWIAAGAPAPANEKPQDDPNQHWAFQQPVRPNLPTRSAKSGPASSNAIDAFITARRTQHNLPAQSPAPPAIWLRRAYLDLIGLPPTLAEIHAFEADHSPEARASVVERLLASPQYGERWGRHFMDIWRYSDWYGLGKQLRNSQKHLWHWRDWIVESVNHDKGYDRMIREMLAGDEIAPTNHDTLRATGFLARNYYLFNRTTWLDDVVEHTGKAFLGLTLNCVKCHDHKYDPISVHDYYAWRAIFEPYHVRLDERPGEPDLERDGLPRAFDLHTDRPTYVHLKGDEKRPDESSVIEPAIPVSLSFKSLNIRPVPLPENAHTPGLESFVLENHLRAAQQEIETTRTKVNQARAALANARKAAGASDNSPIITATKDQRPSKTAVIGFRDNFRQPKPDLWDLVGGKWDYVDQFLRQSLVVGERSSLVSRSDHPRDFEARLKFKHTGGGKWKSVGFCFDTHGPRHTLVYLSAYTGSKLQIALADDQGRSTYPSGAAQLRPVKAGEIYELEIKVRDSLINIEVNGEHALAYSLPGVRDPGRFQLITFDATADFMHFVLKPLPAQSDLLAAGGVKTGVDAVKRAELELLHAEKLLAAAELPPPALQAAWEADRARASVVNNNRSSTNHLASIIASAARAQAAHELAMAEASLAKANLDLLIAAADKRADAEKKQKTAKDALAKARKKSESPGESYTSLRGTRKAADGPDDKDPDGLKPFPTTSTGRRTALAEWITDRDNPLTARVLVNHVWLRHFGQPLVTTVADFGLHGKASTHPELLDWLAVEFMENGWSLKHLHRLMVLSDTYALQSGSTDNRATAIDPENRFYWRMNTQRMDALVLRDSLLHLAGSLDPQMGGPTVNPQTEEMSPRRSLYFAKSRDDEHLFLETFDNANILECYRREESILPQQALALANSKLTMQVSEKLATQIAQHAGEVSDPGFVEQAFETILGVRPDAQELQAGVASLQALRTALAGRQHPQAAHQARTQLVQALLNHNDFIVIR